MAIPATLATLALAVALALATRGHAQPLDPARLGGAARPSFQAVTLELDADQPSYSGTTSIDLTVPTPTNDLRLHAEGLTLQSVELYAGERLVPTMHTTGEHAIVTVHAQRALEAGEYQLRIRFTNAFDTQATSLYRLKVGEHWYTFTQFESDDAREAFPCWDEPEFKIPFQLTLTVPQGHVAITNTPIESEQPLGGRRTVVFQRTRPLPSYLLAIATGPFELVPIQGMSIPGNIVTVQGQRHLAAEAVRVTPPLLAELERYFDSKYPYEKLDILAVPEFWPGAMENPGAVTFADRVLLLDPERSTVSQRRSLAYIMAHELAHMWFGDLVTMKWWDDLWLNESFATWLGYKAAARVFPEYGIEVHEARSLQPALEQDGQLATRAMRQPVQAGENLLQTADALAYEKGCAVLGMFEAWLGEETFRRGILTYTTAHAWKNATADDLWAALSEASGQDVAAAMGTFLDQPGVPLVQARLQPDGSVELSQQRYLAHGVDEEPARHQLWSIPVRLRVGAGAQSVEQTVLLAERTRIVPPPAGLSPQWVHPNAGEVGYYRWSVPTPALLSMVRSGAETLALRERAVVASHAGALLRAGLLGGGDFLHLLEQLANDPAAEVVESALDGLTGVRAAFVTPQLEPDFAQWVRRTLAPATRRFGLEARAGEPEAAALLRPDLFTWLGAWGHDQAVEARGRELAGRFLDDPRTVEPELISPALRLAARGGDWTLFNQFKQRFETAEAPNDRSRFLAALSSFAGEPYQKAALRYSLTGPLRPQELFVVPMNIAQTSLDPGPLLWDWMAANYEAIAAKVPPMFMAYMPYFASGCELSRLATARAFFAQEAHRVPGTEKTLEQVAEAIGDCARLRDREAPAVTAYLRGKAGP